MRHPQHKYDLHKLDPDPRLIERNEAWQEKVLGSLDERDRAGFAANYRMMQVWDLLGLYFCCQEPTKTTSTPLRLALAKAGA